MSFSGFVQNTSAHGFATEEDLPRIFIWFAAIALTMVLLSIVVSVYLSPADDPTFQFSEEGINTALSAICMAMAGLASALVFYMRAKDFDYGALFWLVLAAGCIFLSLDEQLGFHERGGNILDSSSVGGLETFRNWNDVIVIAYGFVVLAVAGLFGREIMRSKTFAVLLAIGFAFFAIHTAVDSIVPSSFIWKDVPEEGSKLISVFFLFLATSARLVLLIEQLFKRQRF
jgi:hypothetical protein